LAQIQVLDNDKEKKLDQTWQSWSGVTELLRALDRRDFVLKRVCCMRAVNVKPDLFKYVIFIEIAGDQESCPNAVVLSL
jgi:hypothetical protein